jgi:hypothetical protein
MSKFKAELVNCMTQLLLMSTPDYHDNRESRRIKADCAKLAKRISKTLEDD